ncbi:MAG: amidohydrolase [Clostridia bacterium]|nr:amidohydrolase [Clostridia bacterium]
MEFYKNAVEKNKKLIIDAFNYIWSNPETGFKEWKTHNYLKKEFLSLGYQLDEAGNIPGFCAEIDTGKDGPTILVFAEMDALIIPSHPECDPETGAVHACGHCTQTASVLGVAAAIKEPGVLDGLCGKIRFVIVPAEESIEPKYRKDLKEKGIIKYPSGKVEFLYRGMLDGGDLAFMIHADVGGKHCGSMNGGSNGLIVKSASFRGISAHAGGNPHDGINALYAANTALNAINAIRETFKDSDHIRVHPVISCGDTSVNAIPDNVSFETFVRGATMDSTLEANKKVNRAIAASAASVGAKVHISDSGMMWPRWTDRTMFSVFKQAMESVLETTNCNADRWGTGSSDIGDISSLMPMVQAYVGGASGKEHGSDYTIVDVDTACVDSAKIQLIAIKHLLENDARKARQATDLYKPYFKDKKEYFAFVDSIQKEIDAVIYEEDGNITLNLN